MVEYILRNRSTFPNMNAKVVR